MGSEIHYKCDSCGTVSIGNNKDWKTVMCFCEYSPYGPSPIVFLTLFFCPACNNTARIEPEVKKSILGHFKKSTEKNK